MLLSDVNKKINEMMSTLMVSLDKEGIDQFFSDPNTIRKHLSIEDRDIEELNQESVFYCKYKDWEHAAETLGWLIFFEPLNSDHFLRLGAILLIMQQYEASLSILETGFSLDSENPEFAFYMGNCLLALGDKPSARELFKKSMDNSRNSSEYAHIFKLASEALYI